MEYEMSQYDPYAFELSQYGDPYGYTQGYDAPEVEMQSGFYTESPTVTSAQEEKRDDYNIACIICAVLLLLLVSGLVLYIVFATTGTEITEEPDDFPSGGGEGGGGGDGSSSGGGGSDYDDGGTTLPAGYPGGSTVPARPPGGPTVPGGFPTGPKVTGGVTVPRPTSTTTETSSPTQSTATMKPFKEQPLLCSVGRYATTRDMYPDDGLCDLIFYTHVRIRNSEIHAVDDFRSFKTFKKVSERMLITKVGISLDSRYILLKQIQAAAGRNTIASLWNTKVRHYGVLNADGDSRNFIKYNHLGRVFQRLFEIQNDLNPDTSQDPNYLVMGTKLISYHDDTEKEKYASSLGTWASFKINMLVVNTAVNTWSDEHSCLNYPPSMWHNFQNGYQPSFDRAIDILKKAALNKPPVILFAFTMGVTAYHMKDPAPIRMSIGLECKAYSMLPFIQLCEPATAQVFKNGVKVGLAEVIVAFYKEYGFAWDSSDTLRIKMNKTVSEFPEKRLGFMLFDVEYEDSKAICNPAASGTFPRIRTVRKFMDDFASSVRRG